MTEPSGVEPPTTPLDLTDRMVRELRSLQRIQRWPVETRYRPGGFIRGLTAPWPEPMPIRLFPPELTDDDRAWLRKHLGMANVPYRVEFGDPATWYPKPPPGPSGISPSPDGSR